MTIGLIIVNVFAAVWCILGLNGAGAPLWSWPAPAIASAVIATLCLRATAGLPPRSEEEGARVGRIIGIWSAVEGVAIVIVVNVLLNIGHARLAVPAVAIIVGLHFFPLARGIPMPPYIALASALTLLGAGAMFLPGPYPTPVAGFGAAILLWVTCIALVRKALAEQA